MKIVSKYSHLNGEEYLLVHHKRVYKEMLAVIRWVDTEKFKTKISEEKTMKGRLLYNPDALNDEFKRFLRAKGWGEKRYSYYVTTNPSVMEKLMGMSLDRQREHLLEMGVKAPIYSYKQNRFCERRHRHGGPVREIRVCGL